MCKSKHIKSFKILGNNIRQARKAKGISQEELAFKVGSARNYIGCIERAEKFPSISFILDIANALDCTFSDITKNI